jgi:hypothetical protein
MADEGIAKSVRERAEARAREILVNSLKEQFPDACSLDDEAIIERFEVGKQIRNLAGYFEKLYESREWLERALVNTV